MRDSSLPQPVRWVDSRGPLRTDLFRHPLPRVGHGWPSLLVVFAEMTRLPSPTSRLVRHDYRRTRRCDSRPYYFCTILSTVPATYHRHHLAPLERKMRHELRRRRDRVLRLSAHPRAARDLVPGRDLGRPLPGRHIHPAGRQLARRHPPGSLSRAAAAGSDGLLRAADRRLCPPELRMGQRLEGRGRARPSRPSRVEEHTCCLGACAKRSTSRRLDGQPATSRSSPSPLFAPSTGRTRSRSSCSRAAAAGYGSRHD